MKKMILLLMALLLTGCGVLSSDFEDDNLRLGIQRSLRLSGLSRNDYDQITHLDLSFLGIERLDGLEKLKNLESLDLSDNAISDISVLQSLDQLRILDLQNNGIHQLEPLLGLENLEVLLIRNNPIDSIMIVEPLFTQLKTTDFLTEVQFEDLAFENYIRQMIGKIDEQVTYYDLDRIRTIDLTNLTVENISGIEHAKNLENLVVPYRVAGLESISSLKNLKQLTLTHNRVGSITFINDLNKLEYLDLSNNSIQEIVALESLTKLKYLDLSFNKIEDVSSLNSLVALETLLINGNYLSDYDAIEGLLSNIVVTDVFIVFFSDINLDTAIKTHLNKQNGVITKGDLKRITSLNVSNYGIDHLGGIELLENLVELDISYNNVADLTPLIQLGNLRILKASYNEITDVQPLKYLTELSILDLSNNQLERVDDLMYLDALEYLLLQGNTIEETTIKESLKEKVRYTDEW